MQSVLCGIIDVGIAPVNALEGKPPAFNPAILPLPLIVTGIRLSPHHIYTIVQEHPDGTVTAIPALIDIGPALIAFFVEVI